MGSKALKGLLYIADDGTRYDLTDRAAGFPVLPEPDNAVLLALLGWAAEKLRVQMNGVRPNPVPPESFPVGGRARPAAASVGELSEQFERIRAAQPAVVPAPVDLGDDPDGDMEGSDAGYTLDELPQRQRTQPAPEPVSEVPTEVLEAALDGLTGSTTSPAGVATLERLRRQAAARTRSKLEEGLAEAGRATEVVVPMEDEPRASERPVRDAEVVEAPVLAAPDPDLEQRTTRAFPDDEIPF